MTLRALRSWTGDAPQGDVAPGEPTARLFRLGDRRVAEVGVVIPLCSSAAAGGASTPWVAMGAASCGACRSCVACTSCVSRAGSSLAAAGAGNAASARGAAVPTAVAPAPVATLEAVCTSRCVGGLSPSHHLRLEWRGGGGAPRGPPREARAGRAPRLYPHLRAASWGEEHGRLNWEVLLHRPLAAGLQIERAGWLRNCCGIAAELLRKLLLQLLRKVAAES